MSPNTATLFAPPREAAVGTVALRTVPTSAPSAAERSSTPFGPSTTASCRFASYCTTSDPPMPPGAAAGALVQRVKEERVIDIRLACPKK